MGEMIRTCAPPSIFPYCHSLRTTRSAPLILSGPGRPQAFRGLSYKLRRAGSHSRRASPVFWRVAGGVEISRNVTACVCERRSPRAASRAGERERGRGRERLLRDGARHTVLPAGIGEMLPLLMLVSMFCFTKSVSRPQKTNTSYIQLTKSFTQNMKCGALRLGAFYAYMKENRIVLKDHNSTDLSHFQV